MKKYRKIISVIFALMSAFISVNMISSIQHCCMLINHQCEAEYIYAIRGANVPYAASAFFMFLALISLLGYNVFGLIYAFGGKLFFKTQLLFFSLCIINAAVFVELPGFMLHKLSRIINDAPWVGYTLIIAAFVITLLNVASYLPLRNVTKEMQTVKRLLWFIIPTVLIWILIYVVTFVPNDNLPGFLREQDYLKLCFCNIHFLKTFLSILLRSFCYALIIGFVLYIVKLFVNRKSKRKFVNKAFYASAFAVCSAFFYFSSDIKAFMGLPPSVYTPWLIMLSPDEIARMYCINLPAILISIQVGIVICFIFWCADKILHSIYTKKHELNL